VISTAPHGGKTSLFEDFLKVAKKFLLFSRLLRNLYDWENDWENEYPEMMSEVTEQ
jgi:hypothetical protein